VLSSAALSEGGRFGPKGWPTFLRKAGRFAPKRWLFYSETHPYNSPTNELLSSSTVHGHVRTLRAFSNWLLKEKLTNINFTAGIKPPKIVKKVISTLSEEEIAQVLSTFNPSSVSDMRNKVILESKYLGQKYKAKIII
jgi:hypothetical protein